VKRQKKKNRVIDFFKKYNPNNPEAINPLFNFNTDDKFNPLKLHVTIMDVQSCIDIGFVEIDIADC